MTDCPNAEVRDLLPDLMHGRLPADARARVEAHVAECGDCRAELALLRDLRVVMRRAPAIDVGAIAAAVRDVPQTADIAPRRAHSRSWVGWRTAAAITLIAAGGTSIAVMQRGDSSFVDSSRGVTVRAPSSIESSIASSSPVVAPAKSPVEASSGAATHVARSDAPPATASAPTAEKPAPARPHRELAVAGGTLNDLSDGELASLLKDIESLDAVPTADVETGAISPISPRASRRVAP